VVNRARATSFNGAVIWLFTPGTNRTTAPATRAQGRPTIGVASTTVASPSRIPRVQWISPAVTGPSSASPQRYHISTNSGKVAVSL